MSNHLPNDFNSWLSASQQEQERERAERLARPRHHGRTMAVGALLASALVAGGALYYYNEGIPPIFMQDDPNHEPPLPPLAIVSPTLPRPKPTPTTPATKTPTSTRTLHTPKPTPTSPLVPGMSAYYEGLNKKQVQQIEHCGNTGNRVLLTFDDSSSPAHLKKITDILSKNNIGAIFFPISDEFSTARVEQLRAQGFWVGNHSKTHPDLHKLTNKQIRAEIAEGVQSDLFRPPYGATYTDKAHPNKILFDTRVYNIATESDLGARVCMWTIDTKDWDNRSTKQIRETVKTRARPGSVVLMHMVDGYKTLDALPLVIKDVRAQGLEFCAKPAKPATEHIPAVLPCGD